MVLVFFPEKQSFLCSDSASLQNSGAAKVQSWLPLLSRRCERQRLRVSLERLLCSTAQGQLRVRLKGKLRLQHKVV